MDPAVGQSTSRNRPRSACSDISVGVGRPSATWRRFSLSISDPGSSRIPSSANSHTSGNGRSIGERRVTLAAAQRDLTVPAGTPRMAATAATGRPNPWWSATADRRAGESDCNARRACSRSAAASVRSTGPATRLSGVAGSGTSRASRRAMRSASRTTILRNQAGAASGSRSPDSPRLARMNAS